MSHAVFRTLGVILLLQLPSFADCPISAGSIVVVRAPLGNLNIETTGTDTARVSTSGQGMTVKETCGADRVEFTADEPAQIRGTIDWNIVIPKTVHLDLVTLGGSITMPDVDGDVTLRTTGGSVQVGNIQGRAAIVTQGGSIKTGNIGGDAELRSTGVGALEVGNITGNADLHTAGGPITAGSVSGKVNASTAGGTITVANALGEVIAVTDAGDILIGEAGRINAKTAGGHITSKRVRGPAQAHTESGDIRLESVQAWVEASSGFGNIYVRMAPDRLTGDLHVNLQTGVGDVTLFIPELMKATVQFVIERPSFERPGVFSDFPMNAMFPTRAAPGVRFTSPFEGQTLLNGGGNLIKLHTSLGKIEFRKN